MNRITWIFSLLTALILTIAALISAFFLMWGMENYKASVKPYAYVLFGVLSFLIIAAAAFAGPASGWAAQKMFPNSNAAGIFTGLIACVLAVAVGVAALFITMPAVLGIFRDPLPHLSTSMKVKFPAKTGVVFDKSTSGAIWNDKLIIRLDADGWEEFRRNEIFQPNELKITRAGENENLRDWRTFENAETEAQIYRWTHYNEPRILKVLARQAGDDQIYVYLYLLRNAKQLK